MNKLDDKGWRGFILTEAFGGGEYGKKRAEMLYRIKFDMPLDDLLNKTPPEKPCPAPDKPGPTKSDVIRSNPTNSSNDHAPVASQHDDVV